MKKTVKFYCNYVANGEKLTRLIKFENNETFEQMKNKMIASLSLDHGDSFTVLECRVSEEDEFLVDRKIKVRDRIVNFYFAELDSSNIAAISCEYAEAINDESYAIRYLTEDMLKNLGEEKIPYCAKWYRKDDYGLMFYAVKARDLFYPFEVAGYCVNNNDDLGFSGIREFLNDLED